MQELTNLINTNTFLVLIIGLIVGAARQAPTKIFGYIKSIISRSTTIDNRDVSFTWISLYMQAHCNKVFLRNTQTYTDQQLIGLIHNGASPNGPISDEDKNTTLELYVRPSPGTYPVNHDGKTIFVSFSKDDNKVAGTEQSYAMVRETVKIRVPGIRNKDKIIESFIRKCFDEYQTAKMKRAIPTLFTPSLLYHPEWIQSGDINIKREQFIGSKEKIEHILSDIKKFISQRSHYTEKGIPYKRGYLLYGPPGTGKTTLAKVIANEFKRDVFSLTLTGEKMSDTALITLCRYLSKPTEHWAPILVIEDIDKAFESRTSRTKNSVSFSGFINILDGLIELNNIIVIITTNHIEKLDPALLRPGRIDYKLELTYINAKDAEAYCNFILGWSPNLDFLDRLDSKLTMSSIRGSVLKIVPIGGSKEEYNEALIDDIKNTMRESCSKQVG